MLILPAINEVAFEAVKSRLIKALEILKSVPETERWIHIDVTDGKFTSHELWNNFNQLPALKALTAESKTKLEIHLMIAKPESFLGDWLRYGADRVIVHCEAMEFSEAALFGDSIGVAINPESSIDHLKVCGAYAKQILLLAVTPGPAGQKFDQRIIEKIKSLRAIRPNVIIEVDGGVNLETGRELKAAGAEVLVSASYLWNSVDPKSAFENLRNL